MPSLDHALVLEESDRLELAKVAFQAAVDNSGGPETVRDWDKAHPMTQAMYLVIAEQVADKTLQLFQDGVLSGKIVLVYCGNDSKPSGWLKEEHVEALKPKGRSS